MNEYIIIRLRGVSGISPTVRDLFRHNNLNAPNHFVVRALSQTELVSFTNTLLPHGFLLRVSEEGLGPEIFAYIRTLQRGRSFSLEWSSRSSLVLQGTPEELSVNPNNYRFFIRAYNRTHGQ